MRAKPIKVLNASVPESLISAVNSKLSYHVDVTASCVEPIFARLTYALNRIGAYPRGETVKLEFRDGQPDLKKRLLGLTVGSTRNRGLSLGK